MRVKLTVAALVLLMAPSAAGQSMFRVDYLTTRMYGETEMGREVGWESLAEYTAEMITAPYSIPGVSDGGAHTKFFTGGAFTTDFLAWMVRDEGKVSLEEAHYRLSFLPAFAAGFRDRGFLREGAPADIVVYDLDALEVTPRWVGDIAHDFPANEWRRVQRAKGYRAILVNGEPTFENGECTGRTPGRLLRHGQAQA